MKEIVPETAFGQNNSGLHRRQQRMYLFIILPLIFNSLLSFSQDDSLYRYIEIATRNNPAVMQRFTEYEAALQKIPQSGGLPDPEVTMGVFLTPMELMEGSQVADVRLMQMFPWFGVLRNAKDEMSLMAKAKYELFRDAKFQLIYDVRRTWYELHKLKEEISVSRENMEILKTIEQLALISYKAPPLSGYGNSTPGVPASEAGKVNSISSASSSMQQMNGNQSSRTNADNTTQPARMATGSMGQSEKGTGLTDLYRIQIEAGDLNNNIALLEDQMKTVIARFNSYLNRPPDSQVYLMESLSADSLRLTLAVMADSVQSGNPMLTMSDYENQSYQARKKMVTAMGYPMVGIGVDYSIIKKNEFLTTSMNGKDMVMPMLTLTLPVYRKKYTAMKNEADLLSKAAEFNHEATANNLRTEFYEAAGQYHDALRRAKLFENQAQLASRSLELTLKNFSASSATLTDVLRIRQQTLDYKIKKAEAVTDLNTSIALLERLMAGQGKE